MTGTSFQRELGVRIRNRRKAAKLGISDLAEKVGTSISSVSRWESGDVAIESETLAKIAAVLKCKVSVLIDGIKT